MLQGRDGLVEALQPQQEHAGCPQQEGDQSPGVQRAGQVRFLFKYFSNKYLKYFVKVDMIIFCMHFRYFGTQKRNDFVGSLSSGCATDFRHYNYRRVPYLGGSDHFRYLNKMVAEAVHWPQRGRRPRIQWQWRIGFCEYYWSIFVIPYHLCFDINILNECETEDISIVCTILTYLQ